MDDVKVNEDGSIVLTQNGIEVFRAYALAKSLILYKTTGIKMSRQYTPKNMMTTASKITGKKFSARDYLGAAQALMDWADNLSQNFAK